MFVKPLRRCPDECLKITIGPANSRFGQKRQKAHPKRSAALKVMLGPEKKAPGADFVEGKGGELRDAFSEEAEPKPVGVPLGGGRYMAGKCKDGKKEVYVSFTKKIFDSDRSKAERMKKLICAFRRPRRPRRSVSSKTATRRVMVTVQGFSQCLWNPLPWP